MKVLITGLSGFIGKGLRKQLPGGHEYFALTQRDQDFGGGVQVLSGDLDRLDQIKPQIRKIRPDICIHLAWEGIPDYGYEISLRNLTQGTAFFRCLIEECGCRKIVATGSCWEYGRAFGACREDDPAMPGSYFAWAKQSLCNFGLMLAAMHSISFIWIRPFYVYGPGQRAESLIPYLISELKKGQRPQAKTALDANDFVYVTDVAQALVKAAFKEGVPGGIYNAGSGISTPVWRICELLEQALGKGTGHFKQLKESAPKATMDFWADTGKARELLQWEAGISVEEGIIKYLNEGDG